MQELGIFGFLILVGAIAFAYLVWQIVKTQNRIADKLDNINVCLSTHDRQGQGIGTVCNSTHEIVTRIDTNVQTLVQQGVRR